MSDPVHLALSAVQGLRQARAVHGLDPATRAAFERDLTHIERALQPAPPAWSLSDPFAVPMETPNDLRGGGSRAPAPAPSRAPVLAEPPPPSPTEVLGARARQTLEAVDFTGFVAGLVNGTFQAIVDATIRQVQEYARLVASLSRSVDEFSRDNVTPNQTRDWLAERHPQDLVVVLPRPGQKAEPRLLPRRKDGSPAWLEEYGLAGQTLDPELTEGALMQSARRRVGEERMQSLATLVLMGINRVVVEEGTIRARLQFHASAREKTSAEMAGQQIVTQAGIAGRNIDGQAAVQAMVSTVNANAQADIGLKADLLGEVSIKFKSQVFDLERFADSAAIQLLNRHAKPPGSVPTAEQTPPGPARS